MSQMNIDHDAGPPPLSAFGESNRKSTNTDNLVPSEKGKLSKPSVGKRKNGYLENGDSIHLYSQMEQYPHLKQPFGASSSAVTSQDSIHKHTPNMDSDSLGCVQMRTPLTHRDYNHTPSTLPCFQLCLDQGLNIINNCLLWRVLTGNLWRLLAWKQMIRGKNYIIVMMHDC